MSKYIILLPVFRVAYIRALEALGFPLLCYLSLI